MSLFSDQPLVSRDLAVGQGNLSLQVQLSFSLYAPTHPRIDKNSLYVCIYGYILFNSSVHAADSISSTGGYVNSTPNLRAAAQLDLVYEPCQLLQVVEFFVVFVDNRGHEREIPLQKDYQRDLW